MKKHSAWLALVATVSACAAEPQTPVQNNGAGDAAKVAAANELARDTLARELQLDASSIEVIASEPQTWPDSSLGCGKPGTMAAQVITPGYAVTLKTPRGNYRVHAAARYAVVCGPATQWRTLDRPGNRGAAVSLKNIDVQIEAARADLASKLGAALNDIATLGFEATAWPDSAMDCAVADETIVKRPIKGYRIALSYKERRYTYHTDLKRVRACPAIATD